MEKDWMMKNDDGCISWYDEKFRLRKKRWRGGHISYYDEQGNWHREDGPARVSTNGLLGWFIHGEEILCATQEEFKRLMRLKAFW